MSRRTLPLCALVALAACSSSRAAPPAPADAAPPPLPASAASVIDEPVDAAPPEPPPPPKPRLTTKRFQTIVWERPSTSSFMLGYFRAGALVPRAAEPLAPGPDVQACGGKWYAVEPAGYVCEGRDGVTLDLDDPVVKVMQRYSRDRTILCPTGTGCR